MISETVESTFKIGDHVLVSWPGKNNSYYGYITYISNMHKALLTIKAYKQFIDGRFEPVEKELRVSETFPTMVFKICKKFKKGEYFTICG